MRRKPGALVPLEVLILEAGMALLSRGEGRFHGYQLAKEMKRLLGARFRTAYGTLYRTLERMEQAGLLESRWEDPAVAEQEGRPRRRFYTLTGAGEEALREAPRPATQPAFQPGGEPA
jgi:DNA-binding PadR family transcriptional regulator